MSTEQDLKTPHDRPPPGEGEPHGAVEEIREGIGQAVESVPKPVRWTVRKLALVLGLSIVGLIVLIIVSALLYVSHRTEWVAQELTVFLNGTLATRSDVTLDIADIRGNPFREVRLIRPRVRFRDGTGPPLLEASSIRVRYSAWGLMRSRERFVDVTAESPIIHLSRTADGKIRVPLWKAKGRSTQGPLSFQARLRLNHGSLTVPGSVGGADGVDLDAFIVSGEATRVLVRTLQWKRGPYATHDLRLSGDITKGDRVDFVLHSLRSAELELNARGGWGKGSPERQIHLEVRRVGWRWLAQATGDKAFDVPGQGRMVVDAHGAEAWNGRFVASGVWNELPADASGQFGWGSQRLSIQPLEARTEAGTLHGKVGWSKQGWEVGGKVERADPTHWGFIGIHDWPKGNLNGMFRYAVDNRRRRSQARLEAALISSEIQGWKADRANVLIDFPAVGPDTFSVHMMRRGGDVVLRGQSTKGGWFGSYAATNFPLDEWPDGRASGLRGTLSRAEGTVVGHGGELRITGRLGGVATDWLGAHMARWRLDEIQGVLLPKSDLMATARLQDAMFLGVHFDSTGITFHLKDQTVALERVVAQSSDTVVTLAGQTSWNQQGWHMALDRAEMKSSQFDWVADPPLLLTGDHQGVTFERLRAHDGPATVEMAGRWASPGGSYDWSVRTNRLDLSRLGMPSEWALTGHADGVLEVRGRADAPHWTLQAESSKPGWQGHTLDSLSLALAVSPSTVAVEKMAVRLGAGAVELKGAIDQTNRPWPDSLSAARIMQWLSGATRWQGTVTATSFPLERLGPFLPRAASLGGQVSGRLEIGGSPAHPVFTASAGAAPLAWQNYLADEVKLTAGYRDDRLTVSELRVTRQKLVSTANGEMPLKLALGARPVVPEAPMAWNVEIPGGDLGVLPLFVPQLGSAKGIIEMHGKIRGTPRHPDLEGSARIRDGEIRIAGREELLQRVNASLHLDESHITLDTLTAQEGSHGRLWGNGRIELSATGLKGYRFDIVVRDFSAVEAGVYAAEFDGRFTVTNGSRVNGQALPNVVGNADIKRAVLLFDFANQSEVQRLASTAQPLFWTYRVQVTAKNNLHWQPPDGDIEFSANLSLEQTLDQLIIYGDMNALRGTYYFLSNRFTVKQADLVFDNVGGVNPVLTIEATTRFVPGAEATSATPETHEVTVHITGRANEPVIVFDSKPADLDEAQILRELTVGRFVTGGGAVSLGDPLDNYLTRAINKTLSGEMSRAFRGYVNEWELGREQGGLLSGAGDVILGVGTQLTPNLMLRYRQRLPGFARETTAPSASASPFERDVEAEYRLNRFFYVTSEVTQRRVLTPSSSNAATGAADFNVNLKARWEY